MSSSSTSYRSFNGGGGISSSCLISPDMPEDVAKAKFQELMISSSSASSLSSNMIHCNNGFHHQQPPNHSVELQPPVQRQQQLPILKRLQILSNSPTKFNQILYPKNGVVSASQIRPKNGQDHTMRKQRPHIECYGEDFDCQEGQQRLALLAIDPDQLAVASSRLRRIDDGASPGHAQQVRTLPRIPVVQQQNPHHSSVAVPSSSRFNSHAATASTCDIAVIDLRSSPSSEQMISLCDSGCLLERESMERNSGWSTFTGASSSSVNGKNCEKSDQNYIPSPLGSPAAARRLGRRIGQRIVNTGSPILSRVRRKFKDPANASDVNGANLILESSYHSTNGLNTTADYPDGRHLPCHIPHSQRPQPHQSHHLQSGYKTAEIRRNPSPALSMTATTPSMIHPPQPLTPISQVVPHEQTHQKPTPTSSSSGLFGIKFCGLLFSSTFNGSKKAKKLSEIEDDQADDEDEEEDLEDFWRRGDSGRISNRYSEKKWDAWTTMNEDMHEEWIEEDDFYEDEDDDEVQVEDGEDENGISATVVHHSECGDVLSCCSSSGSSCDEPDCIYLKRQQELEMQRQKKFPKRKGKLKYDNPENCACCNDTRENSPTKKKSSSKGHNNKGKHHRKEELYADGGKRYQIHTNNKGDRKQKQLVLPLDDSVRS